MTGPPPGDSCRSKALLSEGLSEPLVLSESLLIPFFLSPSASREQEMSSHTLKTGRGEEGGCQGQTALRQTLPRADANL